MKILVVTNYRLGVFGFLYTPEVDANLGLSDQRFTLSWVHENIAAFGGNPDQVHPLFSPPTSSPLIISRSQYLAKAREGKVC